MQNKKLGIIGGSGLYDIEGTTKSKWEKRQFKSLSVESDEKRQIFEIVEFLSFFFKLRETSERYKAAVHEFNDKQYFAFL